VKKRPDHDITGKKNPRGTSVAPGEGRLRLMVANAGAMGVAEATIITDDIRKQHEGGEAKDDPIAIFRSPHSRVSSIIGV